MDQESQQKIKHFWRRGVLLSLALALTAALSGSTVQPHPLSAGPDRAQSVFAPVAQMSACRTVIPLGRAVGIKLFSDGVLVVGLSELETAAGAVNPGRTCGLKAGDVITHINGGEVDTIQQVQSVLKQSDGQPLTLRACRGEKTLQLTVQPVQNAQGQYQLGVWLRDSMAGIGTMTFYDPESSMFAALGHGINDVDTAQLMPLETGNIMYATVSDVKKGTCGDPGELHGTFDVNRDLGTLSANTDLGIYGTLTQQDFGKVGQPMEIASRDQVVTGPATILSNVAGDVVKEYDVEIVHVYPASAGAKRSLMLKVTDEELLSATGGIVQGMSGSPILQNGRIIGAVTHVLVNDPTRGYGVFIEDMLKTASGAPDKPGQ